MLSFARILSTSFLHPRGEVQAQEGRRLRDKCFAWFLDVSRDFSGQELLHLKGTLRSPLSSMRGKQTAQLRKALPCFLAMCKKLWYCRCGRTSSNG